MTDKERSKELESEDILVESYSRQEDELDADDSGHQRYSRRDQSTAECKHESNAIVADGIAPVGDL